MFEVLFDRRRSPIQPWKLAARIRESLLEHEQLAHAIAEALGDERWRAYARALHAAAEALRAAL